MEEKTKEISLALASASEKYANTLSLRAGVQCIPYLGGPLDTLFAGKGTEIQRRRIESFLEDMDRRLKAIETVPALQAEEELFDFMLSTFDAVVRSRTREKIRRLSSLVTNQVVRRESWDDAEAAVRLVSQLEDLHIAVLLAISSAPPLTDTDANSRTATLLEEPKKADLKTKAAPLVVQFPTVGVATLRMVCAELLSRGLLQDEGIGRWDGRAMQMFLPTDLAKWLMDWIGTEAKRTPC